MSWLLYFSGATVSNVDIALTTLVPTVAITASGSAISDIALTTIVPTAVLTASGSATSDIALTTIVPTAALTASGSATSDIDLTTIQPTISASIVIGEQASVALTTINPTVAITASGSASASVDLTTLVPTVSITVTQGLSTAGGRTKGKKRNLYFINGDRYYLTDEERADLIKKLNQPKVKKEIVKVVEEAPIPITNTIKEVALPDLVVNIDKKKVRELEDAALIASLNLQKAANDAIQEAEEEEMVFLYLAKYM